MNDLRGNLNSEILPNEKYYRCQLAALCRLVDLYGWSNSIYSQISFRLNESEILINPFGLLFYEVTASNLVKIDFNGNIINSGLTNFGLNKKSVELHTAIHLARTDAICIIHMQTPSIVAISSSQEGLIPYSQYSEKLGDISYHEYNGLLCSEDRDMLKKNLGPINKILILKNNGIVCIGESIEQLFSLAYNVAMSCMAQISSSLSMRASELINNKNNIIDPTDVGSYLSSCALEYEAHMRFLDRLGYHTGYNYKNLPPFSINDEPHSLYSSDNILPFSHEISNEYIHRSNSDSGAVTNLYLEDTPDPYETKAENRQPSNTSVASDLSDSSFPHSESSRELYMCMSYRMQSENSNLPPRSLSPELYASQPVTPTPKRPKNYVKRLNVQRRSKSLTSGVEKAIFRKITEKIMSGNK